MDDSCPAGVWLWSLGAHSDGKLERGVSSSHPPTHPSSPVAHSNPLLLLFLLLLPTHPPTHQSGNGRSPPRSRKLLPLIRPPMRPLRWRRQAATTRVQIRPGRHRSSHQTSHPNAEWRDCDSGGSPGREVSPQGTHPPTYPPTHPPSYHSILLSHPPTHPPPHPTTQLKQGLARKALVRLDLLLRLQTPLMNEAVRLGFLGLSAEAFAQKKELHGITPEQLATMSFEERFKVTLPPTHPPNPIQTAPHSNRLFPLYPTNRPTHPPTHPPLFRNSPSKKSPPTSPWATSALSGRKSRLGGTWNVIRTCWWGSTRMGFRATMRFETIR